MIWSRTGLVRCGAAGAAAVSLAAAMVGPAGAASSRARVGGAAPSPPYAQVLGRVARAHRLRITLELASRDPLALKAFATAVATPGTSAYGHYLTVPEFAARFGARPADAARVARTLRAEGLRVGGLTRNDMQLPVYGTIGHLERAFAVSEQHVRMPNGRVAYANAQAPTLPVSVAPYVQGVIGLDDIGLQKPQGLVVRHRSSSAPAARLAPRARSHALTAGPQPCASAADDAAADSEYGTGSGYTADEIASAYGIASYYPGDEGAGQTIALFEEQPYSPTDIATYQACYGTAASVTPVNVDGGPGAFNASDGDGEAALDIEMLTGLAPRANVLVYQGPLTATSPADILNAIASQDQAKIVSSSWGGCEALTDQSVITAENTTLQEMAAQGQSFFISSGDHGSTQCYQTSGGANKSVSVIDPGGQPFATAVGGTTLGNVDNDDTTFDIPDNGSYPSEFVWNDGGPGGSDSGTGGGVSDQWAMPTYQSSAAGSLDVIQSTSQRACGGNFCREVPDVSADADLNSGYAVYISGGMGADPQWTIVGGTSAAAPLWAAFTTLADASPTCRGLPLGFLNPSLYGIAGSAYLANFHDISQASPFSGLADNDVFAGGNASNPGGLFPVQAGYDMATGLGTPVANVLGNSLCSARAPVYTVAVADPGAVAGTVGTPVGLQIHAADSGGVALSYAASGLPAGLAINPATGVISGTPTAPQAATVTVAATDGYANTGATQFTFSVAAPAPPKPRVAATRSKLSGLLTSRPKLSFSLAAGAGQPALRSLAVSLPKGLTFATRTRRLDKGIVITAGRKRAKFTVKVTRGVLIITLSRTERSVTVTVGRPALSISRTEAKRIKRRKVKRLVVTVKVTDAARRTTTAELTFRKLK